MGGFDWVSGRGFGLNLVVGGVSSVGWVSGRGLSGGDGWCGHWRG